MRDKVRLEYGLSDKWVIGHTGRFAEQKNHRFIVSVFKELCKITNDAVLVLVGKGVLEQEIREIVKTYNLQDHVIFMGEREPPRTPPREGRANSVGFFRAEREPPHNLSKGGEDE